MRPLTDIEERLSTLVGGSPGAADAGELLGLAEEVLEHWVSAHGETPTADGREGFRLLGLHRQGAREIPSFNACRETCRELVYHYNLLTLQSDSADIGSRARMMSLLANHLYLFVAGKLQVEQLGEFCCASRPMRADPG
jgi:hypothetical protein